MKYTHRVAVMVMQQVIMDIEEENDIEKITQKALYSYFNKEGNPEIGMSIPTEVVVYPWLEEGQKPPKGSAYPSITTVKISAEDMPDDEDLIMSSIFGR